MQPMKPAAIFGYSVVAPFMATVLLVGFAAGCKSFTRYQARADAGGDEARRPRNRMMTRDRNRRASPNLPRMRRRVNIIFFVIAVVLVIGFVIAGMR